MNTLFAPPASLAAAVLGREGPESHHCHRAASAAAPHTRPSHSLHRPHSSASVSRRSGAQHHSLIFYPKPLTFSLKLSVWIRCILVAHAALLVSMPDVSKLLQVQCLRSNACRSLNTRAAAHVPDDRGQSGCAPQAAATFRQIGPGDEPGVASGQAQHAQHSGASRCV